MPSLYADYIKEREGLGCVESERGFATYSITEQECYLRDIYVAPEFRRSGECYKMADEVVAIARRAGCRYLTGTVVPSAAGSTESLKVLLNYGMRLMKASPDLIVFIKEI